MGILSFFVALFGGAYYIGRYSLEKADKRSAEKERNFRNTLSGIITAPRSISESGEKLFSDIDTAIQTIDDEIRDDIRFIFGDEWKEIFKSFGRPAPLRMDIYMDSFDNILNIAFRVWLSKRGYVNSTFRDCEKINPYFGIKGVPLSRRSEIAIKACYILEKNIQQTHPEDVEHYTMFFHQPAGIDRIDWCYDYYGGEKKYLWERKSNSVTFDFGIPGSEHPHRFESYRIN